MRTVLFLILTFHCLLPSFAQKDEFSDSIKRLLTKATDDSVKSWLYLELSDHYNEPRDWLPWNKKALQLADKNIRITNGNRQKYFFYIKANTLGNLGYYYDYIGDKEKTIHYYFEALKLYDKTDSISGKAALYSNLGVMFTNQGDLVEAKEFLNKALILKKKSAPWDLSKNYNNLGVLYFNLEDTSKALYFYQLSLKAARKSGEPYDMATALNNIGNLHYRGGRFRQSLPYFKEAVEQCYSLGDSVSAAYYMCNLGKSYLDLDQIDSASFYFYTAEKLATNTEYIELKQAVAQNLYKLNQLTGDYEKALWYYKKAVDLEKDINDLSEQKESLRQKLEYDHNMELAKKEMQAQEQGKRSRMQILFVSIVLLLILILALVIYSRFRNAQKQKKIIEEQHKEITSSINYALNLQKAILPTESEFMRNFSDGFLFFKPKDIVSGDFYWYAESKEHKYIAVADCTGHGVPGAMVSMVCLNALNTVIASNPGVSPGKLLKLVREQVVDQFTSSTYTAKDGMDISLLRITNSGNEIVFSGAHHSCIVIENGNAIIYKGDRQPIGYSEHQDEFTEHSIDPTSNQWIYLFSDGIIDQFGGPNGKKLKLKPFIEQLKGIQNLNGNDQQSMLSSFFIEWTKGYDQTDDICLIGFRNTVS